MHKKILSHHIDTSYSLSLFPFFYFSTKLSLPPYIRCLEWRHRVIIKEVSSQQQQTVLCRVVSTWDIGLANFCFSFWLKPKGENVWPSIFTSRPLYVDYYNMCQFHQHFTLTFFVRKPFAQLFSNYSLALWFFGKRILVQKLLVKCWWKLTPV